MSELAGRLTALGYKKLFLRLSTAELDAIWSAPDGPAQLEALAASESASKEARFLAAEILFRKRPGYKPPEKARAGLAQAYAAALQAAELANPWGMPGELDEPAGQHFVALGEPAVPALVPLLDDATRLEYGGSKEATVGNSYAYRVKDFAAFYISRIRNLPLEVVEDPAARDKAIDSLRRGL